jgi:selenocysteine-specific elongation factor
MHVIATAGHVDHGKSTLVRALTGIDPDRLREEQQREMTIDLGFAWMTLPNGDPIGIIDVPGHIDFIDNMLAGVGGIDAALLVIAADEGPMPQTLEHLAILDLLKVPRGVVALTKTDLAPDADWVALIRADIEQLLAGTALAGAAIVPVSARAGKGLNDLVKALAGVLGESPPRRDLNKPRLPVDRVFTLQGFGTVVTGTLVDGALAMGDEVEVLTQKGERLPARVRGLQTHKQKLERATPGRRVAVNLSGVDVDQVARGSVVARPGTLSPTTLVDVKLDLLAPTLPSPAQRGRELLRHNTEVKVFSGAAQSVAKVRLLEGDAISAGGSGWAQLQLTTAMALAHGDRFILRLPSPSVTLGGGTVVDAHPARRYRRRGGTADESVMQRLAALNEGTPEERLLNALAELQFTTQKDAQAKAQLSAGDFEAALAEAIQTGSVIEAGGVLALTGAWREAQVQAAGLLRDFHTAQPLQAGLPRDTLRSKLGLPPKVFDALIVLSRELTGLVSLVDEGETVRLATHEVRFNPLQQKALHALLAQCSAQPWNTPSVKDARAALGDAVYEAVLRQKMLVQLGADVILLPATYAQAVSDVREFIQREGQMTAAQARDVFGTTRKYALALMEHLDTTGVTKRVGDARVLK